MDPNLSTLRNFLLNELSEQELIALCKDIGIDYQALAGTGPFGKTRELLIVVQANDQIHRLLRRLQEIKPAAFQAAGLAALRFETLGGAPGARRKTGRATGYVPLVVLLFFLAIGGALVSLLPRDGTLQSQPNPEPAGGASQVVPIPTSEPPALPSPAPTITPDFADSPLADEGAQAAVTDATPSPTAVPSPNPAPTAPPTHADHPAAQTVRQLNELLPRLYTGQASSAELAAYMTGGALSAVMNFNNTRLLRAMRLAPNQRAALEVTYRYITPPTLSEETADSAIVNSREFWRYVNTLNGRVACEVRDYTYTLIKEDNRYRVTRFQSQMVGNTCRD